MFKINGLVYLGRKVVIRGKEGAVEAKKFVTLKTTDEMPSKEEVLEAAKSYSGEGKLKKVWVMEMNGNKWRKAMDVINLE